MQKKNFNLESRLVEFAGNIVLFCRTIPTDFAGNYYTNQIIRSAGSSALHYGEAQGTNTSRDFVHKVSNVLKEIKETRVSLKILDHLKYGNQAQRSHLLQETNEIAAITAKMILNKNQRS